MKYFILFLFALTIHSAPAPITHHYRMKSGKFMKFKWVPGQNYYTSNIGKSGQASQIKKYPLSRMYKFNGNEIVKFRNKVEAYKKQYQQTKSSSSIRATTTTQTSR